MDLSLIGASLPAELSLYGAVKSKHTERPGTGEGYGLFRWRQGRGEIHPIEIILDRLGAWWVLAIGDQRLSVFDRNGG